MFDWHKSHETGQTILGALRIESHVVDAQFNRVHTYLVLLYCHDGHDGGWVVAKMNDDPNNGEFFEDQSFGLRSAAEYAFAQLAMAYANANGVTV